MTWNTNAQRSIAVAIDKDKTSQYALKWALDHIVTTNETLKLVHVKERAPTPRPIQVRKDDSVMMNQHIDSNTMELLLPFRCFCRRRQIQCETVILEDVDVAKALIEYVCQHGVDTLFLGSTTKNGLSRLFKTTDIPSSILKWAPDFCTVYVISKGKINTVRTATRPVPILQRNSNLEPANNIGGFESWYDEMPAADIDNSMICSGRPSTESSFLNFYENLGGCEITSRESPMKSNVEARFCESPFRPYQVDIIPSILEYNNDLDNDRTSLSSFNLDLYEDEMRRLKTELKQTTEMYNAACKEALTLKQKAFELEESKRIEEKRLQEEQKALAMADREKTKCNVAIETAEAVQRLVEIEVQKRMDAEMKALRENEERQKVLNVLSQSHIVLRYQSLYHMIAVLFLFYFYFSIFN